MKKLFVIPAVALSVIGFGNTSTFAASENVDSKVQSIEVNQNKTQTPDIIQRALVANDDYGFYGSGRFSFYHRGGADLRVFISNTGSTSLSYNIYNPKGSYLVGGNLKPGQNATSEFSTRWGDWLPDGSYTVKFSNSNGAYSKVHIAARALE
ncbi:hypothetical protein bcere0016_51690 [Bacillus cereus 95/8201]|uniref:Uncharacterized protein n=1 Tax=Bacillus cereus (strain AH820) TaxID=405535 RepID=B7JHL0_BACC0|nr:MULTISPECIES: hypothetical protein [Bacillus]ACK90364.1 conserved hypothetical protein [Bacillus cereus AH820]AJH65283.1 hypothetical protein BG11_3859 [Bacillus cereus]AJK36321.1 hypothetical protein BF33_4445 [Bacillus cereus]EEL14260.1 hypothetical protein bcere0016_51690 [Bacillus cereus 95/8201]KWU67095.1 hypothetical protein AWW71_06245 [Bacillus cereus]